MAAKRSLPLLDASRTAGDYVPLRTRVVESAYQVFLEHGYAGAKISLIAARARTSNRGIYAVFADKDALFAGVVLAKRHLILDPPPTGSGPEDFLERLRLLFRLDLDEQQDNEREALLRLMTREATLSPRLTAYLYDQGIIRTREIVIDWLRDEQRAGRIAFSDVQVVASLLMDVVFGALVPRRQKNSPVSHRRRQAHAVKCLRVVIAGLRALQHEETMP